MVLNCEEINKAQLTSANISCPWIVNKTAYLCPEQYWNNYTLSGRCFTSQEGRLGETLGRIQGLALPIIVVAAMIAMGMRMDLSLIQRSKWKEPTLACVGQILLNPPLLILVISLFQLNQKEFLSAILISAAPSGVGSNIATVIAGGEPTISVFCTLVSSTLSFGTYILWLRIMRFNNQVSIQNIFLGWAVHLVPLVIGIFLQIQFKLFKRTKEKDKTSFQKNMEYLGFTCLIRFSIVVICILLLVYIINPVDRTLVFLVTGKGIACALVMNIVGILLGYTLSRIAGFEAIFHRTLGIEVGSQNINIPLLTITLSFPAELRGVYAGFVLMYYVTQTPVNLGFACFLGYFFPIEEKKTEVAPS